MTAERAIGLGIAVLVFLIVLFVALRIVGIA